VVNYAVLFPGQGSQVVGMGAELFDERPDLLNERADAILGWSLADLVLEGPEDELTRTERAQPALFAVAYVLWEEFAAAIAHAPAAAAGHSLGEYTALAAAEAVSFGEGLRLVAARGRAMGEAAAAASSGMAALLGADLGTAEAVCSKRRDDGGSLWVANINSPSQIVVAGGAADIDWLTTNARDLGVRRVIPLKVAGAFHSPFMEPAAAALSTALGGMTFESPMFPVYANTTAQPMLDPPQQLARQLTTPVLFAETLEAMKIDGIEVFVHVGPGDVTAGLVKRTLPDAEVLVVSSLHDIPAAAARLSVQ
jgi:[acyl-carrier-protein] S-malonyltransferase